VIISLADETADMRGYRMRDMAITEEALRVE
jgi:hypothetical protein